MKWIAKKPPQHVRDGDRWVKEDEGTLWQADTVKREWMPIKPTTFDLSEGFSIPFPPKTKVYPNGP